MDKAREWLKGKKVYLTLTASLVATVIAWVGGELAHKEAIMLVVSEVLGMFFRAAVEKSGPVDGGDA